MADFEFAGINDIWRKEFRGILMDADIPLWFVLCCLGFGFISFIIFWIILALDS